MDCPFSCLTCFIVSHYVCSYTVDLAIQSLFVDISFPYMCISFISWLWNVNMVYMVSKSALSVQRPITKEVHNRGQSTYVIDLCWANKFSFSAVKRKVLWSEIKMNSAQSTHPVPWTPYCSPLLWSVMKGFERQWVRLHVVSNEHLVPLGNVQSMFCLQSQINVKI